MSTITEAMHELNQKRVPAKTRLDESKQNLNEYFWPSLFYPDVMAAMYAYDIQYRNITDYNELENILSSYRDRQLSGNNGELFRACNQQISEISANWISDMREAGEDGQARIEATINALKAMATVYCQAKGRDFNPNLFNHPSGYPMSGRSNFNEAKDLTTKSGTVANCLNNNSNKIPFNGSADQVKKAVIDILKNDKDVDQKAADQAIQKINACRNQGALLSTIGTYMTGMKTGTTKINSSIDESYLWWYPMEEPEKYMKSIINDLQNSGLRSSFANEDMLCRYRDCLCRAYKCNMGEIANISAKWCGDMSRAKTDADKVNAYIAAYSAMRDLVDMDTYYESKRKSKKPVIKESIRTSAGDNFDSMIQEFKDGVMDLAQLGVDIHNEGLAQGLDITDIEEALMDATEEDGFLKVYQTIARDIEL